MQTRYHYLKCKTTSRLLWHCILHVAHRLYQLTTTIVYSANKKDSAHGPSKDTKCGRLSVYMCTEVYTNV